MPGTNLQAVAKRAGVAVGTIYNHFEDRSELFAELFARRRQELLETLDAATKKVAGSGFDAQLEAYVSTVFSYFDTRRAFLRVALDGQTHKPPPVRKGGEAHNSMEQLTLRAERIVRVGVKEKRLRADSRGLSRRTSSPLRSEPSSSLASMRRSRSWARPIASSSCSCKGTSR